MVRVTAWKDANKVALLGHGLELDVAYEIADGITVSPTIEDLDNPALLKLSLKERAAITTMHEMATFSIEVENEEGGSVLANDAWNHLWDFHLLSLARKSPAFILYSSSTGASGTTYSVTNRNLILNPLAEVKKLGPSHLDWAKKHEPNFRKLISDPRFGAAMRYFGNAHYLFDLEHRIMLLWAGIEGLLQIAAEHSHRIALYSAIMCHGSNEEKLDRLRAVKAAYGLRSRVVHGDKPKPDQLKNGYAEATDLLASLLSRAVELGRVPDRSEFDTAIIQSSLD